MKSRLKLNYSTYESSANGLAQVFAILAMGLVVYSETIWFGQVGRGHEEVLNIGFIIAGVFAGLSLIGFLAVLYCFIKSNIKIHSDPYAVRSIMFDSNGITVYFMDKEIQGKFYGYKDINYLTISLTTVSLPHFSAAKFNSGFRMGKLLGFNTAASSGVGAYAGIDTQRERAYISDIRISLKVNEGLSYDICVTPFTWFQSNVHMLLVRLKDFTGFVRDFRYYFSGPDDIIAKRILSAKYGEAGKVYRNIQLAEFKKILLLSIPTVIAIIIVVTIVSWPFVSHFWGKCSLFDIFFNVRNCYP